MLRWLKSLRRRSDGDEGFSRVVVLLMVLGVVLLAVASAYVFKFQQPQPETVARQPVEELVSQDKLHSGLPLVKSPTAAAPQSELPQSSTVSRVSHSQPNSSTPSAAVGLSAPPRAATTVSEAFADEKPQPRESDYGLEGTVFSLQDGLPLSGCRVTFAFVKVETGSDGTFSLWCNRAVGTLRFSRDGYRSLSITRLDIGAGNDSVLHFDAYLSARDKSGPGRIELNGINGRVFDKESGVPLARARISVGSHHTLSDEAGFFELWGNDSGLSTMRVVAPEHIAEMISGIEFTNLTNPFFYDVSLEANSAGHFHMALVGIGARLARGREGIKIADRLDDSPAAREGIEAGDRLIAVDGLAVDGFSLPEVVELIRGEAGKPVTLIVEREGELLEFTCIRERVVY